MSIMTEKMPDVKPVKLIVMGSSVGGTEAIEDILTALPPDFPPVAVVQHMYPGFIEAYAERIDRKSKISAFIAKNGTKPVPGAVYFAGDGRQLLLSSYNGNYYFRLGETKKVSGHCPSVDALFSSVVSCGISPFTVGVILTGMGQDGAQGLLKMRRAGAYTIGQDEASCVVYGMPQVAYQRGAVARQLPLSLIVGELIRVVNQRKGTET